MQHESPLCRRGVPALAIPRSPQLLPGFAIPCGMTALLAPRSTGLPRRLLAGRSGSGARDTPPILSTRILGFEGARRTLNWGGFHIALLLGAALGLLELCQRRERWRTAGWLLLSASCRLDRRPLFPALLLPTPSRPSPSWRHAAFSASPCRLGCSSCWRSRGALRPRSSPRRPRAGQRRRASRRDPRPYRKPGDTLFVWGYRPELFAFTRTCPPGRVSGFAAPHRSPRGPPPDESQPHVSESAREYRATLEETRPTFVIDGLGPTIQRSR